MREAGVLLDAAGKPFYWHVPEGRSVAYLPDSRALWDMMWVNRDNLSGFAHVHPGGGFPEPSAEDVTTFAAVESALGRRLQWWIANIYVVSLFVYKGSHYVGDTSQIKPRWYSELIRLAYEEDDHA